LTRRNLILLFLTIYVVFLSFLILHFPSVDDFTFGSLKYVESIEITGFVDVSSNNVPCYYILNYIIGKLCNLPGQDIVVLPFQIIPLILILISILKQINPKFLTCCGVVLIYFTSDYAPISSWFVHIVGSIYFLLLITIVMKGIKTQSSNSRRPYDILLIIVILALNFMSYKLTFVSIAFMILAQMGLVYSMSRRQDHSRKYILSKFYSNYGTIFFALILVLFFNHFVYDTFFPVLNAYSEFSSSSGIEKMFSARLQDPNDPLSEYYLQSPGYLAQLHVLWIGLLIGGLSYFGIKTMRKMVRKNPISFEESIVLSLLGATVLTYIIYNLLGLSDMQFLVLTGFIAYAQIFKGISPDKKKIICAVVLIFLLLNVSIIYEQIKYNYSPAQRDSNFFEYLDAPSAWVVKFLVAESDTTRCVTDTLTYTYISYHAERVIEDNIYERLQILSREDIISIIRPAGTSNNEFDYLVANYNLMKFQILGWERFKSESVYKKLDSGISDLIYTSGPVNIHYA